MKQLTRTPGLSYAWIAVSVAIIVTLFARWEWFLARHSVRLWWTLLICFLIADLLFLITPIQDAKSIRRLSPQGKTWAALAWTMVAVFIFLMTYTFQHGGQQRRSIVGAAAGLLLLIFLVIAIFQVSSQWVREPLRTIVAREGGGFLVTFPSSGQAEMIAALKAIPGAAPLSSAREWSLPASPASASALLQFAKRFDFDFVTHRAGPAGR